MTHKITGTLDFKATSQDEVMMFVAEFVGRARADGWDVDDVQVNYEIPDDTHLDAG